MLSLQGRAMGRFFPVAVLDETPERRRILAAFADVWRFVLFRSLLLAHQAIESFL